MKSIDRITRSYLTAFSNEWDIVELKESVQLEHFANFCIADQQCKDSFNIEDIHFGKSDTIGIDGFVLLINEQIITTEDELLEILDKSKKHLAEVHFIQTKSSTSLDSKEIMNFGQAIADFCSEDPKLPWPKHAQDKIKLFNSLILKANCLKEAPKCYSHFVTLGKNIELTDTQKARVDTLKSLIDSENVFSSVEFFSYGASELQNLYKKSTQSIEKEFTITTKLELPVDNLKGVKDSFLALVQCKEISNLIKDDDGQLITNVFYDNVRDFQGSNSVNTEIEKTLQSEDQDAFVLLNNGITIVAEDGGVVRHTCHLSNFQIINGCQTSHVLFENKELLSQDSFVLVKIIISNNNDLTAKVIRSTNKQTEVKEHDLIAFTPFQKKLEDFYLSYSGNDKLYYERRSKQYRNSSNIKKKNVIDKTIQTKAFASIFFDVPHEATRYFGSILKAYGDKMFQEDHKYDSYHLAAYLFYKVEEMFRKNELDKKYKKLKYFILMMLKYEMAMQDFPAFNSNQMPAYCINAKKAIDNEELFKEAIYAVVNKINSLNYDIDDSELSKSNLFASECINIYRRNAA